MSATALSGLTLDALRKALTFEGEVRLRTKSVESDSLLAGTTKSKGVNTAEAECLNPELGLFHVRKEKVKTSEVTYVRISTHGLFRLVDATPTDGYATLIRTAATVYGDAILSAVATVVETCLKSLDRDRASTAEKETALLNQFRAIVSTRQAALDAELVAIEKRRHFFKDILEPKPITADNDLKPPAPKPPDQEPPKPRNEVEAGYQRRICDELAVEYNESPDSRDAIVRVFYITNGMDTFGEPGKVVDFDGRYHQGQGRLHGGVSCRIRKAGWIYQSPSGEQNVLVKAEVEANLGGLL